MLCCAVLQIMSELLDATLVAQQSLALASTAALLEASLAYSTAMTDDINLTTAAVVDALGITDEARWVARGAGHRGT